MKNLLKQNNFVTREFLNTFVKFSEGKKKT